MAPARNLLRRHCDSYGGSCFIVGAQPELHHLSIVMADKALSDDKGKGKDEDAEAAGRSASKEGEESYEGWLQLGTAGSGGVAGAGLGMEASLDPEIRFTIGRQHHPPSAMELDLFPDRPLQAFRRSTDRRPVPLSLHAMDPVAGGYGYRWGLVIPGSATTTGGLVIPSSAATSSPAVVQTPSAHSWSQLASPSSSLSPLSEQLEGTATSRTVISPPLRPQAGVWLMLQEVPHQAKEPFLPQIHRSYLRIKDGRMTVGLLTKYLANKLGMGDDSDQVEITCRGQQLPPYMSLQHVRDNIWCPGEVVELHPGLSGNNHIMIINYSRK